MRRAGYLDEATAPHFETACEGSEMKRAHACWSAVGVVWLLAACSGRDATQVEPTASAGTAGAPTGASGSGGSEATGGSAGGGGAGGAGGAQPTDAGVTRFRARQSGDLVELVALDEAWLIDCEKNPQLVQSVNGVWMPLRDDRPEAFNLNHAAHYLDGSYFSDCNLSLGCDVSACRRIRDAREEFREYTLKLRAREYVQVGEAVAPACGSDAGVEIDAGNDAGVRRVPNIESRAPSAALAVRVRYYPDNSCSENAWVTLDVPVE
jgi:hypothetical protein